MKKLISILMAVVMLLGVFGTIAAEEEPQKITVMGLSWQVTKIFIEEAAEKFMKDHPGTEVVIETLPDVASIPTYAVNWINGETDVDVLLIGDANNASQFVARDLLYDFDEDFKFFEEEGFKKEDFLGVGLMDGQINGKQYGIPIICEAYAMNCNNEAMKEAGLWDKEKDSPVIPETWDDVYEYAKKLHKVENNKVVRQGGVIQWGTSTFATLIAAKQGMDGTIYDEDGILSFESENFRHMLEVWQKGAKDGVFSKETYADNMAGRNSFKAGISSLLLETGGAFVEADVNLGPGTASLSCFPGGLENGSYGFSTIAIVPRATKSPKLAMQFIKEGLLGENSQTGTLNVYGKMPALARYFTDAELKDWQFLQEIANKSVCTPKYKGAAKLSTEIHPILQAYLDEAITLDECMSKFQAVIDSMEKSAY
jgi:multiple sugar transport system substrate-binding protein